MLTSTRMIKDQMVATRALKAHTVCREIWLGTQLSLRVSSGTRNARTPNVPGFFALIETYSSQRAIDIREKIHIVPHTREEETRKLDREEIEKSEKEKNRVEGLDCETGRMMEEWKETVKKIKMQQEDDRSDVWSLKYGCEMEAEDAKQEESETRREREGDREKEGQEELWEKEGREWASERGEAMMEERGKEVRVMYGQDGCWRIWRLWIGWSWEADGVGDGDRDGRM
jgi:hypothetical protein